MAHGATSLPSQLDKRTSKTQKLAKTIPVQRSSRILTEAEVLNVARYFGGRTFDISLLRETVEAHPLQDAGDGDRWRCATPLFHLFRLSVAAAAPEIRQQILPIFPNLGQIKSALSADYSTKHFAITWDTTLPMRDLQGAAGPLVIAGKNFGPLVDSATPKFVQAIGLVLEVAWQAYVEEFGYRDPCSQHPTSVTIMDLYQIAPNTAGLGAYDNAAQRGNVYLHYDLDDADLAGVPLHEFFHVVQGMYHAVSSGPNVPDQPEAALWSEGSADLAPDFIVDQLNIWMNRFNWFLQAGQAGLGNQSRPPLNALSYPAAGVWRYMLEQCSYPAADGESLSLRLRQCWESTIGQPQLNANVFSEAFNRLAPRGMRFSTVSRTHPNGLDILCSDTLVGNFMLAATRRYRFDSRFDFAEDQEPPKLLALVQDGIYAVRPQAPVSISTDIRPWEFRFYSFDIDPSVAMVRFSVHADPPAAAHIVLMSDGDLNVIRTDSVNFDRALAAADCSGIVRFGMFSLATQTCRFNISASSINPVADLIITRANCLPAFDSERDPVANPWDGASPDIYLGSPGQLEYDVMENGNVATVFVCVHNKGLTNAYANVRLFIQFIPTGDIWDTEWQPMRDKPPGDPTGRDQVIGLTVPQRGQATANATWHINADSRPIPRKGWHQHSKYGRRIFKGISRWAIRAVVECPEDGSPDNNSSVQFVSIASRHEIYIPWPAQPAKGTKHPKEKHPKKKRPKKKAPKKQTHAKRLLSPKLCATAQLSIAGVPR